MRLLIINAVCGIGSTGRICADLAKAHQSQGWDVKIAYGRSPYVPEWCKGWAVRIGNSFSVAFHALMTRLFDVHGTGICSYCSTRKFLEWVETWHPDVIWLHNLHGYYINFELLFRWIKRHPKIKVKWTLHDSWAYTGHCAYFMLGNCNQWKFACARCHLRSDYPRSFSSRAKANFFAKKRAFLGVSDLELVIPSKWLAEITRQGFLGGYPMKIIPNTIDTAIFKPVDSDFREIYGICDKVVILGVASVWDKRKGFEDFVRLREMLSDEFVIVLVGLSKRQIKNLKHGMLGIEKTNCPRDLAAIYTACDWFFNPTREDIFSMTNMEAAACGCRVVTYDTGGAPEAVEGYEKAWALSGNDKTPAGFVRLLKMYSIKGGGGGGVISYHDASLLHEGVSYGRAA